MHEIDCLPEVDILFGLLEKHSGKDKRLTANKLAELCASEVAKTKSLTNKMNKCQVEQMVLELLLRQFLREEFSYTAYNTICYLVKGDGMRPRGSFKIILPEDSKSVRIGWAADEGTKKKSVLKKIESVNKTNKIGDDKDEDELMVVEEKNSQLLRAAKRKSDDEIFVLDSSSDDDNDTSSKKLRN